MKALLRLCALVGAVLVVHASAPAATGHRLIYWSYGVRQMFTPGAAIRIEPRATAPAEVTAALYRLSVAEVLDLNLRRGDVPEALLDGRKSVRSNRRRIVPERLPGDHEIVLPGVPPGLYALRLRANGGTVATPLVTVGTLGVSIRNTESGVALYAVDVGTLHGRGDVTIDGYAANGAKPESRTVLSADDAVAVFPVTHAGHGWSAFVARGNDGSVVVSRPPPDPSAEAPEIGYAQIDRPLYRPGHHVMYRAILRAGMPGAYTVPSGERSVRLIAPDGKTVARSIRALDAFGVVAGEIALPDDAALGTYQLLVGSNDNAPVAAASLAVEAYKKPEYVVDVGGPKTIVGGEPLRFTAAARYFYGRPVAQMKLHYRAYVRSAYAWWRRGAPFEFSGYAGPYVDQTPAVVEGDLTADAQGRATIAIPTQAVATEKRLQLEVDGRDDSGRTVTALATTIVAPASFYLTVVPDTYFVNAGDAAGVTIRSLNYGSAVPRAGTAITLTAVNVWRDAGGLHRETLETKEVVTDASGAAAWRWQTTHGGYVEIRAAARDERGRDVVTVGSVWISDKRYADRYVFQRVTVVPQKASYLPGERARVLVTAPVGDVDALIRVTGGPADLVFVRRLPATASAIDVDLPADVPSPIVDVEVPTRRGIVSASARLHIAPPPHRLQVAIRPDKTRYGPGERARFAIAVHDLDGKPMRAEVGMAVVDDAIFVLRAPSSVDAFALLYGTRYAFRAGTDSWNTVDAPLSGSLYGPLQMIGNVTSRSMSDLVRPGTTADVYSASGLPAAPEPSFAQLRNDFRDTAFWAPAVTTGSDGRADVTFDWPDSLTSYTAAGVAVTQASDVGSGTAAATVSKDFLVRLSAPRFLRSGDAARVTAVAQGRPAAKSAKLRFSAPDLGVADVTSTAAFDPSATATARWTVRGTALGSSSLRLAGTSGALSDGVRIAVPVEAAGSAEHDRSAGVLPSNAGVALALRAGAQPGDLRIDLAPSPLAQLIADTRLLQVYPYYCVEQTMSAALPAIYVDRVRKHVKLPLIDGPTPESVAKRAVDRLVKLQHADGSWGWWEHDAANPFMTAYALYGLAELSHEGYDVPAATLANGVSSVVQQLGAGDTLAFWGGAQPNSEWNTRAYMLFALADAAPAGVDRELLVKTDAHVADLNSYALAVLGLAHVELGDRDGARPLLDQLLRRVTDDGSFAHWAGQGWHYRWEDDPIETTAYALRFVHALAPSDPHVAHAVNWLRAQQHGSWFVTTKDTAAAIYAMSEALAVTPDELRPHETVRVTLDGHTIKTVRVDAPVLPRDQASIVVPARLLRHGGAVRFEREGTGSLAWSTDWVQYVRQLGGTELDPTFSVTRTYTTASGNDWRIGDLVDVDVQVTAHADSQYVAIEDPFPAGLEYQPRQYESGDGWSGLQFFDDRVVFFAARISADRPIHLHYTLRATTAGTFTAPAPTAYAMYGPATAASGRPARITIR